MQPTLTDLFALMCAIKGVDSVWCTKTYRPPEQYTLRRWRATLIIAPQEHEKFEPYCVMVEVDGDEVDERQIIPAACTLLLADAEKALTALDKKRESLVSARSRVR